MEKLLTILITAAGNVFMPGTTACLKHNGEREIRLIGADMNDDSTMLSMVDACYPVPRGDDPGYVEALLDICKKEQVDILMPIMSVELVALAENRQRFAEIGTRVAVSPLEGLRIASDKLAMLNFQREQGLRCPEFYRVRTVAELREAAEKLGYPQKKVCVKATDGSGSRGFRILDGHLTRFDAFFHEKPSSSTVDLEELADILSERESFPELLAMEYLPGKEYTVDLLADQGKVLVNCCRESLRMENSIMLDSLVVHNPDVEALCAGVTQALGLDGNIGFDVRERADGTAMIMECNPRMTAGIPVFNHAGVNLPWLCVKKLLGEELPPVEIQYGTVVKRRWMEMD